MECTWLSLDIICLHVKKNLYTRKKKIWNWELKIKKQLQENLEKV